MATVLRRGSAEKGHTSNSLLRRSNLCAPAWWVFGCRAFDPRCCPASVDAMVRQLEQEGVVRLDFEGGGRSRQLLVVEVLA